LNRAAAEYIAREAARRYGDIEPRTVEYLQRNIRRNFGVRVPREDVLALLQRYKHVYAQAARLLPKFLMPPKGRYCDAADVRIPEFKAAIAAKFPEERAAVVDMIAWYAIFYEYLK
jgi:hypothetical protein